MNSRQESVIRYLYNEISDVDHECDWDGDCCDLFSICVKGFEIADVVLVQSGKACIH